MDVRLTMNSLVQQAIYNTGRQTDLVGQLTQEAQTGNRVQQPSDDPVAAVQIFANQAQDNRLSMYLGNVTTAQTTLNDSVSTLTQVGDALAQAKSLAIQGSNSSNDPSSYAALASEVDGLITQVQGLANTQNGGYYLYSGTAVNTKPFVTDPTTGAVTYQGTSARAGVPVNQGQSVDTYYSGSEIFQSSARQPTTFSGTTGAVPGPGTDSGTGDAILQVRHTATTYAAGSGVKAGTSSVTGDTILGPSGANQLTIVDTSGTGAAGTVSLNGGAPVAFTSTDTNLQVTDANGQTVYVDTSAIAPGFNGQVAITAGGTLSIDGGASTVPIDFTAGQVVTDSRTGAVTHVDTTKASSTGDEQVTYPGTSDVFQVLTALRNTLRNTSGLSSADQAQALSELENELDRVHNNVLQVVGEQSASLQHLQNLQSHLQDVQLQGRTQLSGLQSADMASVAIQLQSQQNLLQVNLAATARLFNDNLLQFLQ